MAKPRRGEVWLVDLNPARGHEQAGKRPALVISVDLFKCEDIRSVSTERLLAQLGEVSRDTIAVVEDRVRILLGL